MPENGFFRPAIICSKVDLPEPFGPVIRVRPGFKAVHETAAQFLIGERFVRESTESYIKCNFGLKLLFNFACNRLYNIYCIALIIINAIQYISMLTISLQLINKLQQNLTNLNDAASKDGALSPGMLEIKILGQMSLIFNQKHEKLKLLPIVATKDFDALIKGSWSTQHILRETLKEFGLYYDELSPEIWIVPGTIFHEAYRSNNLTVKVQDPLYTLTCKAIKAPEKNKELIYSAITTYGEELINLIQNFGGDINYFLK